ncbi:methylated-DNA--[protein]-cysteine S-methyltransferase [Aquabacterium sp.]|uniref:methylated-DNA--[protein]-cysteine S-methyltransferase n=1 Tax=Aquabacterium sp. TaxID=1872578 RepID=UPI0035B2B734
MSEIHSRHGAQRTAPYTAQTVWTSPLGALRLARTACGLAGAWFVGQKDDPGVLPDVAIAPDDPLLAEAVVQLDAYWRGQRQQFDLPLDLMGTPFQRRVWQALLHIPFGQCGHYGDIAMHLGQPKASRAVGGAIGRNPISVIVPCHRVIGQNGTLTGYSGGMPRKVALLQLEGHMLATDRLL